MTLQARLGRAHRADCLLAAVPPSVAAAPALRGGIPRLEAGSGATAPPMLRSAAGRLRRWKLPGVQIMRSTGERRSSGEWGRSMGSSPGRSRGCASGTLAEKEKRKERVVGRREEKKASR
jgi:hypothetical protein